MPVARSTLEPPLPTKLLRATGGAGDTMNREMRRSARADTPTATGRTPLRGQTTSGRMRVEGDWPLGGVYGGSVGGPGAARGIDRNWDVQAFTGFPVSTVPAGAWARHGAVRGSQPATALGPIVHAYDPTNGTNMYATLANPGR